MTQRLEQASLRSRLRSYQIIVLIIVLICWERSAITVCDFFVTIAKFVGELNCDNEDDLVSQKNITQLFFGTRIL